MLSSGGGGGGGAVPPLSLPASQPLRVLKDSAPLTRRALASCVAYGLSSTTSTLLNKTVFSQATFHYPWFTLACQNVMSIFLLGILARLGVIRWSGLSPRLCRQLLVPIAFFVLFIFSNAQALRYVSLPVLTVLKSAGPIAVTLFERSVFRDVFPPAVYASMLLVAASTVVTAAGDLAFSATGYGWAAANVAANVGYLASLRHFVRGGGGHTPLEMTLHSNLLALAPILPLSWASGELPSAAPSSLAATSGWFLAAYVASGMLTTAICASGFWCLRETNGSTYSFLGGLNKIPIVVLGSLLFDAPVSARGWVGVALSIVAGVLFVRSKAVVREGQGGAPGGGGGAGAAAAAAAEGGGGAAGSTGTGGAYRRVMLSTSDGGGHAAPPETGPPGADPLGNLEVVVGVAGDKGGGKAAPRHIANISSGH